MSAKADLARKVDPETRRWSSFAKTLLPVLRMTDDVRRTLLAIKFHDQLLIHRQLNILTLGQCQYAPFVVLAIDFEPRGLAAVCGEFFRLFKNRQLAAAFADRDLIADTDIIGRNVDLPTIHSDVPVAN